MSYRIALVKSSGSKNMHPVLLHEIEEKHSRTHDIPRRDLLEPTVSLESKSISNFKVSTSQTR